MSKDGEKKVADPTPEQPADAPKTDDQQPATGTAVPSQPETEDDHQHFGILPQRDLKKNLGCG